MLDTEYQALLSEIDRIANDTEFNGVAMVSGNAVTSTTLNSQATATNFVQAADGFQTITFDSTVTNSTDTTAVFTFAYSTSTSVLTATNTTTGESQGIDITSAAIAAGSTQTVNFTELGAVVTLNSAFDKSVEVAPAAATTFTSDSAGQIEATSITLVSADASTVQNVTTTSVSLDASVPAATTFTLGALTGSADLTSTGTKTVALSDGTNDISISLNVTTAFTTDDTAAEITVGDLGTLVLANFNTANTSFSFKLGTGNVVDVDSLTITVDSITTQDLSLAGTNVATLAQAEIASAAVSASIDTLNTSRANVGAAQNRLDFAAANLSIAIENAEAARSNLLDLDIAQEMTTFTSKQILVQTGVAMLAQANQLPQNLLRLFQ
jgi:flagellin